MDLKSTSQAMAEAAAAGRWDEATRHLWRRTDLLDGPEAASEADLRAALEAGERTRAAAKRLRAELAAELQNLRAAKRSTGAWRPYRETSGGTVDLSS
jgi:hypothetical protein